MIKVISVHFKCDLCEKGHYLKLKNKLEMQFILLDITFYVKISKLQNLCA